MDRDAGAKGMESKKTTTIRIDLVRTPAQAASIQVLAFEFVEWLRGRYPEMATEIDTYLQHQKFDEDMPNVRAPYAPPHGECLLADMDGTPAGILMLKELGSSACEMNRMHVRDAARGRGVGRVLVLRLIERAREMGFVTMTLSPLPRHHEALALYRSAGFREDHRVLDAGNTTNAVLMRPEL